MPLSLYAKDAWLSHMTGDQAYSPASSVYIAFFTSITGLSSGSLTNESSDLGRTAITFGASSGTTQRAVLNTSTHVITPTTGSETVTHFAILDSGTGSANVLCYGPLDAAITTATGVSLQIASSSVGFQMDAGGVVGCTVYFIDKMNDLMFRNVAYSMPSNNYMAYHTATSLDGSSDEPSSGGYTRQSISWGGVSTSTGDAVQALSSSVTWTAMTANSPAAQWSIWDSASGGNCLAVHDTADVIVPDGSNVTLSSGLSFTI